MGHNNKPGRGDSPHGSRPGTGTGTARLGAVCTAAALAALPVAARAGAGPGMPSPRYQFARGERFAYDGVGSERIETTTGAGTPHLDGFDAQYVLTYRVARVAPDGTATVDTRLGPFLFAPLGDGTARVSRQAPPPEVDHLGADNTLPGQTPASLTLNSVYAAHRSYGVQLLGPLPATLPAPGTHLDAVVEADLTDTMFTGLPAGLPPARVVADNLYVGARRDGAAPLATFAGTGTVAYAADARSGDRPVHVTIAGRITYTSALDLARHRLYAGAGVYDLTAAMTAAAAAGGGPVLRQHVIITYAQRPHAG